MNNNYKFVGNKWSAMIQNNNWGKDVKIYSHVSMRR